MKYLLAVVTTALALSVSACGDKTASHDPRAGATRATQDTTCAHLAAPGSPVLQKTIDDGCTESDGSLFAFTTIDCKDGRTFTTYDDKVRGFVGDVWKTGATSTDADYTKDYTACLR